MRDEEKSSAQRREAGATRVVDPVADGWYAVCVKSRLEFAASPTPRDKGFTEFVPKYVSRRNWLDRKKQLVAPLFPSYLFRRSKLLDLRPPAVSNADVWGVFDSRLLVRPGFHRLRFEMKRRRLASVQ
jgi:hypothetical protein